MASTSGSLSFLDLVPDVLDLLSSTYLSKVSAHCLSLTCKILLKRFGRKSLASRFCYDCIEEGELELFQWGYFVLHKDCELVAEDLARAYAVGSYTQMLPFILRLWKSLSLAPEEDAFLASVYLSASERGEPKSIKRLRENHSLPHLAISSILAAHNVKSLVLFREYIGKQNFDFQIGSAVDSMPLDYITGSKITVPILEWLFETFPREMQNQTFHIFENAVDDDNVEVFKWAAKKGLTYDLERLLLFSLRGGSTKMLEELAGLGGTLRGAGELLYYVFDYYRIYTERSHYHSSLRQLLCAKKAHELGVYVSTPRERISMALFVYALPSHFEIPSIDYLLGWLRFDLADLVYAYNRLAKVPGGSIESFVPYLESPEPLTTPPHRPNKHDSRRHDFADAISFLCHNFGLRMPTQIILNVFKELSNAGPTMLFVMGAVLLKALPASAEVDRGNLLGLLKALTPSYPNMFSKFE